MHRDRGALRRYAVETHARTHLRKLRKVAIQSAVCARYTLSDCAKFNARSFLLFCPGSDVRISRGVYVCTRIRVYACRRATENGLASADHEWLLVSARSFSASGAAGEVSSIYPRNEQADIPRASAIDRSFWFSRDGKSPACRARRRRVKRRLRG